MKISTSKRFHVFTDTHTPSVTISSGACTISEDIDPDELDGTATELLNAADDLCYEDRPLLMDQIVNLFSDSDFGEFVEATKKRGRLKILKGAVEHHG